ncbi:MAG: ABC transporter permease [Acidobacteriota bacterium]|nr:ABC transporter permease [Acidobacteriota bacterium]
MSYGRLLWLLRSRDVQQQQAIKDDAERLLEAARARGRGAVAATWLALLWDLLIVGAGHDVARALRALVRAPGFTLTVSLLLGLGVAATTTLFALVNTVILKPLPYADPEQLVSVWESNVPLNRLREGPSPGNLHDFVANNNAFEALTGWWTAQATLRGRDGSAPVTGVQVTEGFFEVFRRAPLMGRTFSGDEYEGRPSIPSGRVGPEPILVLSHRLWQTLGADPALVGGSLFVEGRNWRVLGVMPPDFAIPDLGAAFWTPWDIRESYSGPRFPEGPPREARFLKVAGRLKPELSIDAAAGRMEMLAARIAANQPKTNSDWTVRLVPLSEELVRSSRTGLLLVFGAVFCLLMLVCANVASLAVARGTARARELAIRLALGAGRTRIVREHLAETALGAVLTALVAIVLTSASLGAVIAFAPSDIPRLSEVEVNAGVVSFAVALAVLATIIGVGLPGLRGSAPEVSSALKDGAPASGQHASRIRRALVVAEIAVTVVLLVGAGLLARSFAGLQRVDPGFDTENLLVMRVAPDVTRYRGAPQVIGYYNRVFDSIRELPGVASVAAVTLLPMSTIGADFYRPYWLEGAKPDGLALAEANIRMATPGYFATLGLPLVSGREFSAQDAIDAPRVVIVNESLARSAWPGLDPIGRSLVLDYQGGASARQVVGIVRDARYKGPRSEPAPEIFVPHAQNPYLVMNVLVRTTVDPSALAQSARAQALKVDPDQPVHSVTTMERLLDDTMQQDRFAMLLVALFAAAGLVTAATGVYALLAYTVGQRRREIAVRMAIGASSASVGRLVVMESLTLALVGCVVGGLGVAAISRLARSMLFGIAPEDPLTLVTTAAVLLTVVLAASWLPARRAARINPVSAMRV